jgi:hypothetical protein
LQARNIINIYLFTPQKKSYFLLNQKNTGHAWRTYLKDNTHSIAISQPHGFELIINKCKLRPIFGKGWERTRNPKQSNIFVWGQQLVELSRDIISMLQTQNNIYRYDVMLCAGLQ